MKRQVFITLLGSSVLWPLAGRAQNTGTKPRIGFLGNSSAALESNLVTAFRDGLREFGYEDGRNIDIDYRWAEGNYELFSTLAAELVAQRVAVIVTAGTPAVLAVKNTTQSVPIVMVAVGDPLGTGQGSVGELFRDLLERPYPPSLIEFAHAVDFSRENFDDDRTLIAMWPKRIDS